MTSLLERQKTAVLVLVAALGYFVDIYDLILFSVVRIPSLRDLGLHESDLLEQGVFLLNLQMAGMLLGGILFGVLGDKRGRVSVLFGSILLYSIANFLNAFVSSIEQYALLRFIAGIGLAGELGAGITLVTESLPREKRGLGTTIVASVGVSGALLAWYIASAYHWRTAYIVGGVMGFALLLLRLGVFESGLFENLRKKEIARGDLTMIFKSRSCLRRFVGSVLIGAPLWYVVGILITLSPEFAQALGVKGAIEGGKAVFYNYAGLVFGDLASGLFSQYLRNRKRAIGTFLMLVGVGICIYFFNYGMLADNFYYVCFFLGIAAGYWAMFVTVAAEQFGTNLRATVATSVPNLVRGSLIPISAAFMFLREPLGILVSGFTVGAVVLGLSFVGLWMIDETYATSMEFEET